MQEYPPSGMTYDLDALKAAWDAERVALEVLKKTDGEGAGVACDAWTDALKKRGRLTEGAVSAGLLDDAALGRAVRAAAERDGPELAAMLVGFRNKAGHSPLERVRAAARALVGMKEQAK